MSYCEKCGAPLNGNQFCTNCGHQNGNDAAADNAATKKGKSSKPLIIVIIVLAVIVIAMAGIVVGFFVGKAGKNESAATPTDAITTETTTLPEETQTETESVTETTAAPQTTAAPSYSIGYYRVPSSSSLNIYKEAGANSAVIVSLVPGDIYWSDQLYVTSVSGEWGYTPDWGGYVNLNSLTLLSASQADVSRNVNVYYFVKTSAGLNVRSTASTSGTVLTTLSNNTAVYVTNIDGAWGYAPEYNGWINLNYCESEH